MWRIVALEWTVTYEEDKPKMEMAWFIDGRESKRVSSNDWFCNSCSETHEDGTAVKLDNPLAPFDQPFHIILNLAVGGTNGFAGLPPGGTVSLHISLDLLAIEFQDKIPVTKAGLKMDCGCSTFLIKGVRARSCACMTCPWRSV